MKKIILLFSNLIIGTTLFGQISAGLNVGSNICYMKQVIDYSKSPDVIEPEKTDQKPAIGIILGIPVEIKLSDIIAIYSGITYYQKGGKTIQTYNNVDTISTTKETSKINYMEIPVMGKFYFTHKTVSAYAMVGPSVGYAINAKYKINDPLMTDQNYNGKIKHKDLHDSGISYFDFSIAIGGGMSYKVWKGNLFLNIIYSYGITNIVYKSNDIFNGIKEHNRGLGINLGYLIPLSK